MATPPPPRSESTASAPPARRFNWLLWVGLAAVIVLLQWPLVKDLGSRAMGIEPAKDNIPWQTDFGAATAEAKAGGKPMLVDFTASWCPPCQMMKRQTWPDKGVHEAVTAGYVPVMIDVDAQPDVARRFGVTAMPTVMVIDATGKVLRKEVGFLDADGLVAMLR